MPDRTPPTKPEVDPARHESPKAYAEVWYRYYLALFTYSWGVLGDTALEVADPNSAHETPISRLNSFTTRIEYARVMAEHFLRVVSVYEDPSADTDGWEVYSISLGREILHYRPIVHSDPLARAWEEIKREATADFLRQVRSLLDSDLMIGRK